MLVFSRFLILLQLLRLPHASVSNDTISRQSEINQMNEMGQKSAVNRFQFESSFNDIDQNSTVNRSEFESIYKTIGPNQHLIALIVHEEQNYQSVDHKLAGLFEWLFDQYSTQAHSIAKCIKFVRVADSGLVKQLTTKSNLNLHDLPLVIHLTEDRVLTLTNELVSPTENSTTFNNEFIDLAHQLANLNYILTNKTEKINETSTNSDKINKNKGNSQLKNSSEAFFNNNSNLKININSAGELEITSNKSELEISNNKSELEISNSNGKLEAFFDNLVKLKTAIIKENIKFKTANNDSQIKRNRNIKLSSSTDEEVVDSLFENDSDESSSDADHIYSLTYEKLSHDSIYHFFVRNTRILLNDNRSRNNQHFFKLGIKYIIIISATFLIYLSTIGKLNSLLKIKSIWLLLKIVSMICLVAIFSGFFKFYAQIQHLSRKTKNTAKESIDPALRPLGEFLIVFFFNSMTIVCVGYLVSYVKQWKKPSCKPTTRTAYLWSGIKSSIRLLLNTSLLVIMIKCSQILYINYAIRQK